jgi:hypothetical protein
MEAQTLVIKPVLRSYLFPLTLASMVFALSLYFLAIFPTNGIYVYQFLKIHNAWLRHLMMNLLKIKIPYSLVFDIMAAQMFATILVFGYYLVKVKSTSITFTNKYICIAEGVFSQTVENIDMVDVRDQEILRSVWERLWGLSRFKLESKDMTVPHLMLRLASTDANDAMEFIRTFRAKSIVDYQLSRDLAGDKSRGRFKEYRDLPPVDDKNVDDKPSHDDNGGK